MTTWGYCRVSTDDQGAGLAAQMQALAEHGIDILVQDEGISGTKMSRPGLNRIIDEAQPGDVVIFYKLDRAGRSTLGVLNLIADFERRGVDVKFLRDNIDTTTAQGKFLLRLMVSFAELERDMISDRTKTALAEIKRTGIGKNGQPVPHLGRPSEIDEDELRKHLEAGDSISEVARKLNVSRPSVYRAMERMQLVRKGVLFDNK